jgi:hypothetical protein
VFRDDLDAGQVEVGEYGVDVAGAEDAHPDGYYKGSVYSRAIHMLLDHTGALIKGKWLGFNRDGAESETACGP